MSSVSHPRKRLTRNQASGDDNPVLGSDSSGASSVAQQDEYTADYIHQLANIDDDDDEEEEVIHIVLTLIYCLAIITIVTMMILSITMMMEMR